MSNDTAVGVCAAIPAQRSTEDLVAAVQAGDSDAFGPVYERYHDSVYRFIYRRVGGQHLAEDLTADVFVRALKNLDRFTWQGRDLGAWLITIARNLVADHYKSGRYRMDTTTEILDSDGSAEEQWRPNPEAIIVEQLTNAELLAAIAQLTPDQRQCIVLRFLEECSVADTAAALQINVGAVKSMQYRATRALRRILDPTSVPS